MMRVALVVPGFEEGGGVPQVARFLAGAMRESGRYVPEFISVPMASSDPDSVSLRAPSSWLRGLRVQRVEHDGETLLRVGAYACELEFQRYRPRRVLTELLSGFDLVQVVAGCPAWGWIARDFEGPSAMQVATLSAVERAMDRNRGGVLLRSWRGLMLRIIERLETRGLASVNKVFVENQWMAEHVRGEIGAERVIFAPPGVDTDHFHPAPSETSAPGRVLCVGRLADVRKRCDLLIEAYARLCERLEDPPELLLVGSTGPPEKSWALARARGVRERIEFRPDVSRDELARLYRSASVFALSSDEEGLGIVILEAMASGLPVVSTDCGGPSTSVVPGETGLLVPRGDPEALAAALEKLCSDSALRRKMGSRARARAEEHFALRTTGARFIDWYDRVLEKSAAGPASLPSAPANAQPQSARRLPEEGPRD